MNWLLGKIKPNAPTEFFSLSFPRHDCLFFAEIKYSNPISSRKYQVKLENFDRKWNREHGWCDTQSYKFWNPKRFFQFKTNFSLPPPSPITPSSPPNRAQDHKLTFRKIRFNINSTGLVIDYRFRFQGVQNFILLTAELKPNLDLVSTRSPLGPHGSQATLNYRTVSCHLCKVFQKLFPKFQWKFPQFFLR